MAERGEMPGIIGTALFIVAAVYGSFCLYLFLMQGRMLFYPTGEFVASPDNEGLSYESVFLTTSDSVKLHGWFIPAKSERGVVLFFHGNAGNISHRLDSLKIFNGLGLTTLIIDYRGYGRSEGSISEHGMYLDGEAAWNYLTENKRIPSEKIIIFGRSLGAAVAAHTAARKKPGGLILESAFTSVVDMGASLYPYIPVRLLSRYEYDIKKTLPAVSCPVLIIHSPFDELVDIENGLKLYEIARAPKEMLRIRGGHNDGFLVSGKSYIDGLDGFIETYLSGRPHDESYPSKD